MIAHSIGICGLDLSFGISIVAPKYSPKLVSVLRYNDDTTMNISWNAIIPNHTNGEGNMFRYDIEYRSKEVNTSTMEQVFSTSVYIEGLYSKGVYEVRVRCVVLTQKKPMLMYESGPWSGWVESKGQRTTAGA